MLWQTKNNGFDGLAGKLQSLKYVFWNRIYKIIRIIKKQENNTSLHPEIPVDPVKKTTLQFS